MQIQDTSTRYLMSQHSSLPLIRNKTLVEKNSLDEKYWEEKGCSNFWLKTRGCSKLSKVNPLLYLIVAFRSGAGRITYYTILSHFHSWSPVKFSALKPACPFMFQCIVSYFMDKIFSKMYIFNLSLELYQSFSTAWVYTLLYWSSPFCGKIKEIPIKQ